MSPEHQALLAQLIAAGPTAVRELAALLDSNAEPTRLRAAESIARLALDAAEQSELLARVVELEQRVGKT